MEKDYQELLTAISCMLDEKLEEKLDQKFDQRLSPITADLTILKEQVVTLNEKVMTLYEQVVTLDEKVMTLDEKVVTLDVQVGTLHEQVVTLNEKMDVVQIDISDLKKGQERNARIIENQIIPDIRLLAENYVPAAQRYQEAEVKRNAMETDIKLLKLVVADHSTKLCEYELLHK